MEFSIKKSSTRRSARVIARFPIWCSALFTYGLEPLWGGRRGREQAVKPGRSRPPPTRVAAQRRIQCSRSDLHRPRSAARAPHSWLRSSIVRTMPTSHRHPGYSRPHRQPTRLETRWSSRPRGLRASTCSGRRWPRPGWPPRLPCSLLRHMADSPHRKTAKPLTTFGGVEPVKVVPDPPKQR
jgi:hypothetical protein